MNAAQILQLIAALGPAAFELIKDLLAVWTKPSLTPEEVLAICDKAKKSYDEYIAQK